MRLSLVRIITSEFFMWLVLASIGLYLILPFDKQLRFGMDLRGGTYLTLMVHTDKAVEAELIQKMRLIETSIRNAGLATPIEKMVNQEQLTFTFHTAIDAKAAADSLKCPFSDLNISQQDAHVLVTLSSNVASRIKQDAVTRNIEVLRSRLDGLGVAEISVAAQGESNIVIELPDVSDPTRARAMIGTAAQLEFKLVESMRASEKDLLYELDDIVPPDKEILPGRDKMSGYYLVEKFAQVTGRHIKETRAMLTDDHGTRAAVVAFRLNDEGAEKFGELTSEHMGAHLAIVLDGQVISAPRIQSKISDSGQITGMKSLKDANELALLLRSGAFGAPVTFEEDRQVDPLLGKESIRQGLLSCLVALLLLFIFSVIYYRWSGVAAFAALVLNLIFLMVGLRWLGATLTLPGIGGMVLTVGMAIDASILIFERIRELIKDGVAIPTAVKNGFSGAMAVILDANITTFLIGIVLYKFGTGPIQGFAVTMMLGIVATLITGLFFLRSVFNFVLNNFTIRRLSI